MAYRRTIIFGRFAGWLSRPAGVCLCCWVLMGCVASDDTISGWVLEGELGQARAYVAGHLTENRSDRKYLLDRMRLAILTLADGYPTWAQTTFEQVYDVLRTQGINQDKTVESVVLNEDLKIWKGEPFEQAMAMFYYGVQQAMLGHWDNTRAAAGNSLFRLRDFGDDDRGQRIDTLTIARRALAYEEALARGEDPQEVLGKGKWEGEDYLNTGYAVRDSNFTLGYILNGLANHALGRPDEARDHFAAAVEIDQTLKDLCRQLYEGRYNTVLVVSFGLGPEKVGYGPDASVATFVPRTPSDESPLAVHVGGRLVGSFPIVCDLNGMALDHMWNNLEDVRRAKSELGSALLLGGIITQRAGRAYHSDTAQYAGLAAILTGVFMKAGAHVDTRYCNVMPQRVYVVPLDLSPTGAKVTLQVEQWPASRIRLIGLRGPSEGDALQLRYVRLVGIGAPDSPDRPPAWAVSGQVYYSNDVTGPVGDTQLPYILGGRCVRMPEPEALASYQEAGYLKDLTENDLRELYRAEEVATTSVDQADHANLHLLEGGRSLATPMAGTAGFTRLFGQVHPPYRPQSKQVQQWISDLNVPAVLAEDQP